MNSFIPEFNWKEFILAPWGVDVASGNLWIVLMGFFVTAACGLVGNYLILRRMALVGDAISHSILPGLVIAYLIAQRQSSTPMFIGALAAGILTTLIIEVIHKKSRVKQDAAIGIAFTTLFAIGVILISLFASRVDLDQECVLYGEIAFVPLEPPVHFLGLNLGPLPVARMGIIAVLTAMFVVIFYKQLLVSSFDPGLARSLGINSSVVHYALMCWLSVVVVSAFESVGAILVVAMLIMPGATASLLSQRLPTVLWLTIVNAALSSLLGMHLATWLDCSTAGAMVVMATFLFCLAWIFGPVDGLIWRRLKTKAEEPIELTEGRGEVL